MANELLVLLYSLLEQLEANRQTIQIAVAVGGLLSAAFSLYRTWYYADRRERRRHARAVLAKLEERVREESSPTVKRATNVDVLIAVQSVHSLLQILQSESRRAAFWGFAQNLIFFLMGTITSILIPKFVT